jgi:alpha-ketoglutarate-dependent taurine dioxygenase
MTTQTGTTQTGTTQTGTTLTGTTLTGISVRKLTTNVGAVVEGVDASRPLEPAEAEAVGRALLAHGVLFFRDQQISDEQMEQFVAHFDEPVPEPFGGAMAQNPKPASTGNLGPTRHSTAVWHSDTSFVPVPPGLTALRAVEPCDVGGDTCWLSMHAAYDALSEPMRSMLDGLTAVHSMYPTMGKLGIQVSEADKRSEASQAGVVLHPLIRVHPETGRKALYYSEAGVVDIVELTQAESEHIRALLREHLKSPDFAMRWHWAPNDLALWDNRAVQHYAVPDYTGPRVMQRVVTRGQVPVGPGVTCSPEM